MIRNQPGRLMGDPAQLVLDELERAEDQLLRFFMIVRLKLLFEDGCDSVEIGLLYLNVAGQNIASLRS